MNDRKLTYWNKSIRYIFIIMAIWFVVAQVLPVFAADFLNQFKIGGFPLGIWFAFQGCIILFVILLFVYNYLMDRLDEEYDIAE